MTRSLDEVEITERWYEMHREIIESHKSLVVFIRKWITYAKKSAEYWGSMEYLDLSPLESDKALEIAKELLSRLAEASGEEIADIRLEIDGIISRCDPVLFKWPGRVLWSFAKLLMLEGRNALALKYMDGAAEDFDGREMPLEEMYAFFKDYARASMGHDLTHTGNYEKAEQMLSNAAGLCGIDEEIKSILGELLDSEISHYTLVDEVTGRKRDFASSGWFSERAKAQKAMYEGDLKRALMSVWNAIRKHWKAVPGWAASHLDWLVVTLEKCIGVEDPLLAGTVDVIITEMASSEELIGSIRLPYTEEFAALLKDKGLSVELIIKQNPGESHENLPPDELPEAEELIEAAITSEEHKNAE